MTCHCSKRVEFYRHTRKRRWPAEVQSAIEQFRREFGGVLDDIRESMRERIVDAGPSNAEQIAELVITEHEDAVVAQLLEGGRNGVEAGRRMASRRFGLDIDFSQEPVSAIEAVEENIDSFSDDSLNEMSTRIGSDLEDWFEEGIDTDEIADRIQSQGYRDQLDRRHAQTHARTLVQGASERGNHHAMQEADGVVGERWNVTNDGRARETHLDAGGQIVPVDTPFIVDGARLMHPGDPNGPIGEIANCRCYATPVFEDDLTDGELAQLRAGNRLNI